MSDDRRGSSSAVAWVVGVVLILGLYVFSAVPVFRAARLVTAEDSLVLNTLYAPLIWISENSSTGNRFFVLEDHALTLMIGEE